jgi:aminoglycoside phosphotransferase (APT) family kinase protein
VDRLPSREAITRAASALWEGVALSGFRFNDEGWANLILETRQGLLFRFPRRPEVARGVAYEVRLLRYLAPRVSVPVPRPLRVGSLGRPPWPFVTYRRLAGSPLAGRRRLGVEDRTAIRDALGHLLDNLRRLSPPVLRRLGCPPGDPHAWARRYATLLARFEAVSSRRLPVELRERIREDVRRFRRELRRSTYRPVLSHLDLGPYNLLWDARAHRVSGVIDWEDARLSDPAFDLTGLGFLGDDLVEPLVRARARSGDPGFRDRLAFYRRFVWVHEVTHAFEERNSDLARRTTAALERAYRAPIAP